MSEIKVNSIKGVGASSAAITVNNTDGTCTANITSVNDGQLGNRRININGGFQVFQRSTSATSVGSSEGYFAPDRYRQAGTGNVRYTASQSTDVPAGYGFSHSLKYDCTTASGTVSAGHYVAIEHRIEGQDLQVFCKGTAQAKQFTLSFHVKSPKTGIHWAELYDNDNDRHVCKSYTISSADTWQKISLTFPADTAGAFGNDNQASLRIFFWLMAGTDYATNTPSTVWANFDSDARATGQVNVFDSTSNDFFITGIQLEVGSIASDFEHRSFTDELKRSQRYFQYWMASYRWSSTSSQHHAVSVYPSMRALPTVSRTGDYFGSYEAGSTTANVNFQISSSQGCIAQTYLLSYGNSSSTAVGGHGTLSAEL